MTRLTSNDSVTCADGDARKFGSVTRHLRYQDFRWLKEDMGFFNSPEDADWPLEWVPPIGQSTGQRRA